MNTMESIIAGSIAGMATVLITNPIWVVNTRVMTKKNSMDDLNPHIHVSLPITSRPRRFEHAKSFWYVSRLRYWARRSRTIKTIIKIFREDGIFAFWQGVIPAMILVINPIIQYTIFEQLKGRVEDWSARTGNNMFGFQWFIMGAISKLAATFLTYPYIVVKSRMQLKQSSNETLRYHSVTDGLYKIAAHEGIRGLYKGLEMKLLQSVLTAAFLFWSKERLYQYAVALVAHKNAIQS